MELGEIGAYPHPSPQLLVSFDESEDATSSLLTNLTHNFITTRFTTLVKFYDCLGCLHLCFATTTFSSAAIFVDGERGGIIKSLMPAVMKRPPSVNIVLFNRYLIMVMLAMCVVVGPTYSKRLLPTVSHVRCISDLLGRMVDTK